MKRFFISLGLEYIVDSDSNGMYQGETRSHKEKKLKAVSTELERKVTRLLRMK